MLGTGLVTKGRLAPGGDRTGTADRRSAFTTTVRVIAGVHDRTADSGSDAHVAGTSGLTDVDVLMLEVSDLTDGGHAVVGNVSQLARGESEKGVAAFLSHELSDSAAGSCDLSALAGIKLDVVYEGTDGDARKGKAVANYDVGAGAGYDLVADLKAVRSNDVSLLAILILYQRDVGGTVGIVLKSKHSGGHIKLVTLEIDDSVLSAVSATLVANGDSAVAVTARSLLKRSKKAPLGGYL